MDLNQSGRMLRDLRKEKGLTQSQVAQHLGVCAKTVSKWETGHGFPDVETVLRLAQFLEVSAETLLSGRIRKNAGESGNLRRRSFYVCPDCGNFALQMGAGEWHCCGKKRKPLEERAADGAHSCRIEPVEDDVFLTFDHEMTKQHFLSHVIGMRYDSLLITRLYPEQNAEIRIPRQYAGRIYCICNIHGLYRVK